MNELDSIGGLLKNYLKRTKLNYGTNNGSYNYILSRTFKLLSKDDGYQKLPNINPTICSTYPTSLFIPNILQQPISEFQELVERSRSSRVRSRFPVGVLQVNNKHILRSSAVRLSSTHDSLQSERLLLKSYNVSHLVDFMLQPLWEHGKFQKRFKKKTKTNPKKEIFFNAKLEKDKQKEKDLQKQQNKEEKATKSTVIKDQELFYRIFGREESLQTKTIEELNEIKGKKPISISESHPYFNRYYSHYKILNMPFDCLGNLHFFRLLGNDFQNYKCEIPYNDFFHKPSTDLTRFLDSVSPQCYRLPFVELLKIYFKEFLQMLAQKETKGILIHCIAGWDRTPLFISLLRLSLWADGVIHQSLNPEQLIYLTVAYDWLLFHHDFAGKTREGIEVLYFTFWFLQFLSNQYFSLNNTPSKIRKERLGKLINLFQNPYLNLIPRSKK
ncbi:myotubularin-related protein [Anaeramoeba flamelloides]|uniref:Myotubularin-related protein n=1 Tax=Anaeramoeba flamelloides TaxID=1746091 RepID=A0AAV7ZPA1_9EUKA|nr:myotubularin-related protein [Anaeramoeba flamelloides]